MSLTPGVDTYATLSETLAKARGLEGAAFVELADANLQEDALARAADAINSVPYSGVRLVPSQSLALPRSGLRQSVEEQLTIAKQAQILHAFKIAPDFAIGATVSVVNPSTNGNVKRTEEEVGAIKESTEYFAAGASKPGALDRFSDDVRDLLSQLMNQTPVRSYGQGSARRVS